jgi:hypothetical protein
MINKSTNHYFIINIKYSHNGTQTLIELTFESQSLILGYTLFTNLNLSFNITIYENQIHSDKFSTLMLYSDNFRIVSKIV